MLVLYIMNLETKCIIGPDVFSSTFFLTSIVYDAKPIE